MKRVLIFIILFLFAFSVNTYGLEVSAKAAVLLNGSTGEILYCKNENEQMPMASTTKIMTALLLAEQNTPEKTIVVRDEMIKVEGSSMGLLNGDTVTYNDLLYGMLLSSGNDAANVTAYAISGSLPEFSKLMNAKAKQLGLINTNFVTPSGLDDNLHYTTAKDLALLSKYAMQNKSFAQAAGSKTAILCYGNPPYKRAVRNHNKLLASYSGLIGVKTGFTKKSGRCLVTAAKRSNKYLIAVTLNAPNDWTDHTNMLDYGFSILEEQIIYCDALKKDINVVGGIKDNVSLNYDNLKIGLTNNELKKIKTQIIMPSFVYAPIEKGQKIGDVIYFYNNEKIASTCITASSDIKSFYNEAFLKELFNTFIFLVKQFRSKE